MPTYQEIQSQIQQLSGTAQYLTRKEVRELPSILWSDESVQNIAQGLYKQGHWLIVATNKRLLFISKMFTTLKVEDYSYNKITSIQYETSGSSSGKLSIFLAGQRLDITIEKITLRSFGEGLRALIDTKDAPHPVQVQIQMPVPVIPPVPVSVPASPPISCVYCGQINLGERLRCDGCSAPLRNQPSEPALVPAPASDVSEPLFNYSFMGIRLTVYRDRVEQTMGSRTVLVISIADIADAEIVGFGSGTLKLSTQSGKIHKININSRHAIDALAAIKQAQAQLNR